MNMSQTPIHSSIAINFWSSFIHFFLPFILLSKQRLSPNPSPCVIFLPLHKFTYCNELLVLIYCSIFIINFNTYCHSNNYLRFRRHAWYLRPASWIPWWHDGWETVGNPSPKYRSKKLCSNKNRSLQFLTWIKEDHYHAYKIEYYISKLPVYNEETMTGTYFFSLFYRSYQSAFKAIFIVRKPRWTW